MLLIAIVVALTIQVIFFIDIYLFFIETYLAYARYTHGSQAIATSCPFRVPVSVLTNCNLRHLEKPGLSSHKTRTYEKESKKLFPLYFRNWGKKWGRRYKFHN